MGQTGEEGGPSGFLFWGSLYYSGNNEKRFRELWDGKCIFLLLPFYYCSTHINKDTKEIGPRVYTPLHASNPCRLLSIAMHH